MFSFFRRRDTGSTPVNRDITTKQIALSLLYTFIGSIVLLFIINVLWIYTKKIEVETDAYKAWFELLKNGLLLLGTALTTVIGYYFGQREGAIKAAEAKKEIENTERKTEEIVNRETQKRDRKDQESIRTESDAPDPDEDPREPPKP